MDGQLRGQIVNISIPAKLAYDLDRMQSVVRDIAGRLGCGNCHSGFDFRFRHDLDFVVNEAGEIHEGAVGVRF